MTEPSWDAVADVVVVGFGAAGACAAIEAVDAGADVLVLDRFNGGGATAISGGIVYAGGGTRHQTAAGVEDTPEQMFAYLRLETADAVSEETLRSFCEGSVDMLAWLESHGVPFEGSLAPYKTSYPTNEHYLYYSGNELSGPARAVATPAQRGHRAKGKGTSGKAVFAPLRSTVEQRGARIQGLTRAEELVTDEAGAVVGVVGSTIEGAPAHVVRRYRWMAGKVGKLNLWYRPAGRALSRRLERIERRWGRRWAVRARRGVVLSAGGFAFNREMVREHAAPYAPGLPLGTLADDGSGILMGQSVGGATKYMDRASAWRFYTPPSALAKGVLLGPNGERVCNEALYGAAVAEAVIHEHGGAAHLLVDQRILAEARKQVSKQTLWFQRLQTITMFGSGRTEGASVAEAAAKVGIDAAVAERTVAAYNDVARTGTEDPLGKPDDQVQEIVEPPYSLIDISVRSSVGFPCPTMTLGGLAVDERTGQVLGEDGQGVPGLYAAGRTAAGICSNSYVSGLSLADCVYSGRRAGRHVGRAQTGSDRAPTEATTDQEESADAVR
ncbi:MAG TPA: FAD-binding protein [Nocardioidaceae bacterium]|nr:FAD-binding protein [Nocardioidaceae bacterium]